jgi:patatin-like phospholipase/acyl hydrolase
LYEDEDKDKGEDKDKDKDNMLDNLYVLYALYDYQKDEFLEQLIQIDIGSNDALWSNLVKKLEKIKYEVIRIKEVTSLLPSFFTKEKINKNHIETEMNNTKLLLSSFLNTLISIEFNFNIDGKKYYFISLMLNLVLIKKCFEKYFDNLIMPIIGYANELKVLKDKLIKKIENRRVNNIDQLKTNHRKIIDSFFARMCLGDNEKTRQDLKIRKSLIYILFETILEENLGNDDKINDKNLEKSETIDAYFEIFIEKIISNLFYVEHFYNDKAILFLKDTDIKVFNLIKNYLGYKLHASELKKENYFKGFIRNELFSFLKSFIFGYLNYHVNSIYFLSQLYLSDKIKFATCYKILAKIMLPHLKISLKSSLSENGQIITDDEIEFKFYMFFNDFENALKFCENSTNNDIRSYIELLKTCFKMNDDIISFAIPDHYCDPNNVSQSNKDYLNSGENRCNEDSVDNIHVKIPLIFGDNDINDRNNNIGNIYENSNNNNQRFNILSIDGGGIKGLIPLYFLSEIEEKKKQPVYDLFQMFAGTSIGGLFALIFSQRKYCAKHLLEKIEGPYNERIFHPKKRYERSFLKRPIYNEKYVETLLKEELGNKNIISTSQGNYLIASNIESENEISHICFARCENELGLYHISLDDKFNTIFNRNQIFDNTQLWKVGRATLAARPYFHAFNISQKMFIDDGVSLNNPSKLAYLFAINHINIISENIRMLSLGCSHDNGDLSVKKLSDGGYQYVANYVQNTMKLNNNHTNEIMSVYLKELYFRISPGARERPIEFGGILEHDLGELKSAALAMIEDKLTDIFLNNLFPE